jgi:hypothetical protein
MNHTKLSAVRTVLVVAAMASVVAARPSLADDGAAPSAAAPSTNSAPRNPAIAPIGPQTTVPQTVVDPDGPDRIIDSNPRSAPAGQIGVPGQAEGTGKPKLRQREGAKLVERRGRFEIRGDRVIFLATNPDAHYVVLENLSLERVTRVLEESGSQLEWSVSGTLTEFRASNYLQISRALVKSLPAKAEPRKFGDPLATSPIAPAQPSGFTEPRSTR